MTLISFLVGSAPIDKLFATIFECEASSDLVKAAPVEVKAAPVEVKAVPVEMNVGSVAKVEWDLFKRLQVYNY